ncbi:MAG TPA: FecR family protein [Vicinamibacteria bacterium]|nr:FecR family protein [Vicinamibacteria bacterium]
MPPDRRNKPSDDLVDWFTVTYKSIFIAVSVIVVAAAGVGYYFYSRNPPPAPPPTEAAAPVQATAHFTAIEGNVKVKAVGTFEWVTADPSMVLKKSDLVRTGPGSAAEIRFFDGTVVAVRADSLITIEETAADPSTRKTKVAWHISSGEVRFQVPRQSVPGSQTEISTPTVRTTARDQAAGAILVQQSGESDVRLYEGKVEAKTKSGDTVELTDNEGFKVDAAGRAGPELKLPGVPALLAPAHESSVAYPDPARATTLLAWRDVPGATAYHVMLDYSPHFNRPLVDDATIRQTKLEVRGLDVGKYYWRVAARTPDGVEGNFSGFGRFTVARPGGGEEGSGPPPALVIDSLDVRSSILQVKGRTEPGATLTVNGQRVDVHADGTFNEFIQLTKPGRQIVTLRSQSINGGVNEQRRTVVVAE